jgi:alkylation response protein AidB-like acyl-CoA dehydrogenase
MDLELSDEQTWLAEAVETLLDRHWVEPGAAWEAAPDRRAKLWTELVEFGALTVGDEGLGAIELCLIARALGSHLASTPFIASAAIRWAAAAPLADSLPPAFAALVESDTRVALAHLESGGSWTTEELAAQVTGSGLDAHKLAVDQAESAEALLVLATADGEPALVLVASAEAGVSRHPQPSFDPSVPVADVVFERVPAHAVVSGEPARRLLERLSTIGALLAAAEAVGASGRLLEDALAYAGERKQFGHTIGSNQALRHLLADIYVRQSSSWSTVLYAAAALDEGAADASQTASIAKAYVSRSAREVAHGALQVFGGIAFTAEHSAHRFLRRIIVRERQFGDASHHERALGRALAVSTRPLELAEGRA